MSNTGLADRARSDDISLGAMIPLISATFELKPE